MAKGTSGRIVVDVDPALKSEVYIALAAQGSTLKDWFLKQARQLCDEQRQPLLLRLAEQPTQTYSSTEGERTVIALHQNGTAEVAEPKPRSLPDPKQKVIHYREAFRFLLSSMASEDLPDNVRAELPAIISHWLQCPAKDPLVIDRKYAFRWRTQLSAYAAISTTDFVRFKKTTAKPQLNFTIDFSDLPFPPHKRPKFTFVDIFAGIGGFRIALQQLGGKCVFSCEWDKHSKETYYNNFGEVPFGDIRQFTNDAVSVAQLREIIPEHDLLAAGFPCQPFSRAGVSARNALGQRHGFLCEIQGTLFFDIVRIVEAKAPDILLLENVKSLQTHDGKKTFQRIERTITQDLKYSFSPDVIDASPLVPQRRKRCYMVCFRNQKRKFSFPLIMGPSKSLGSILEEAPDPRHTLSERMWIGHINRTRRNLERGTGFTAFEADLSKPSNTLVARYYKDGKECLVPQRGSRPRMLTPRECARLQGFPESFLIHPWDMQAYRQFGNSVVVPVIERIAEQIVDILNSRQQQHRYRHDVL